MPNIEVKQSKIEEIKKKLEGATSIVLVDHRGLTVEEDTALRKELREAHVDYTVYKNTMMNFAFKGTEFEAIKGHLEGPSALAISYEDATSGPRVLEAATKKFKNLEFKAGVVEGVYYDANGIKTVATIPSREELLSKLLGSLKSPISTFARTVKAIADKAEEASVETAAGIANKAAAVQEEAVKEPEAKEPVTEEPKTETTVETTES